VNARLLFGALAAFALLVPTAPADAQRRRAAPAAPVVRDWTQVTARTNDGGIRFGNPNAPVKVIEFISLACPHCAAFSAESDEALFGTYVRSGRVSIEYRNIVLHGPDLAATVLTRCAAPLAYLEMSRELLRTQQQWLARINDLTAPQRRELNGLSPLQTVQRMVPLLGLDQVGARYGLDEEAQRACLANQDNLSWVAAIQNAARTQYRVSGTPTFVINGQVAQPNDWAGLEPLLQTGR